MPALNFLGRKWLVACDDFVVPAAIDACLRIIWFICTFAFLWLKISNCEESVLYNYFLYAAAVNLFFTSCLSLGLMLASGKGSVLEIEKRKSVPILLFIKLITFFCDAVIASFGIWLFTQMDKTCIAQEVFIKTSSILTLIYLFIIVVGVLVCYDSLGASKYWNIEASSNSLNFFKKAQYVWRMRLKLFCCCADISENNDFIYVEISTFLASFLNGIDLVPTDILSGIITLSQKHVLERRKHMMQHLPESVKLLESTSVPNWMTAENALHFLRIAKSTYGWIAFFDVFHPWSLCVLSSQAGCCFHCGNRDNETIVDNCCYLNFAAVQKISNFGESDIVFASFRNNIHEPAFYVAANHARKYVVVAIRGTSSFSDLITDIDAETLYFPLEGKHKFKCHRGALRSALYVQNKLNELNILERVFSENPTYSLVLTGHSLGGSIAAILTLLLRPKYPHLQCYSYAPLTALSSLGIVDTLENVLSVVIGEDMIPRLSASACNELRNQLINSLRENSSPKYKILAGACWYHIQKFFKMSYQKSTSSGHENQVYKSEAEDISQPDVDVFHDESKLYAPGRILYFERKVWDKPFWLTGLNLQSIIINPDMIVDHQPHRIQHALDMYLKSIQEDSHVVVV